MQNLTLKKVKATKVTPLMTRGIDSLVERFAGNSKPNRSIGILWGAYGLKNLTKVQRMKVAYEVLDRCCPDGTAEYSIEQQLS